MELVEIQFKGQRKELYVNSRALYLHTGNYCVVQADRGEDMGLVVSIVKVSPKDVDWDMKEILRHASDHDIQVMEERREKEVEALKICQQKAAEHDLQIKLVDVEYQFDGNKITFYFTADGRIDFRELVKDLAGVFRTRIDLRQIGVRDEARRFDGMGMCGRRLCCSTWLKDFEPVTLKMAKDQSLPLTPSKISGACGSIFSIESCILLRSPSSLLFPGPSSSPGSGKSSLRPTMSYTIMYTPFSPPNSSWRIFTGNLPNSTRRDMPGRRSAGKGPGPSSAMPSPFRTSFP